MTGFSPALERRLLQSAVAIGCLSPLTFGLMGAIQGPAMLAGVSPGESAADLVSHYRYLSGLFAGLGLMLLSCVPRIERRTARFRWAAGAVVVGGLARLGGMVAGDDPSPAHLAALGAELVMTPLLVMWQARISRGVEMDLPDAV